MSATDATPIRHEMSLWQRLHHGETNVQIVPHWKRWFAISGIVILVGLVGLFTRGLNLGIDFSGGNVWEVPAGGHRVEDVEAAANDAGLREVQVQENTSTTGERTFRVTAETVEGTPAERQRKIDAVDTALAEATGRTSTRSPPTPSGPSWGKQISEKARNALIVFLVAIMLYITIRFEWKMALATVAALVHDILVVIGVYAIFAFPVTPETVIAILTILGFSIYDGIVVFDRIDENAKQLTSRSTETYDDMANRSLNQVLMRSLNTSITALLPILSILVVGSWVLHAETLRDFGLALFIGVLSGAYSSLFIATPILVLLKDREPRFKALRRQAADGVPTKAAKGPSPATVGAGAGGAPTGDGGASTDDRPAVTAGSGAAATRTYSSAHPPRPRKKGKKR